MFVSKPIIYQMFILNISFSGLISLFMEYR